MSKILYAASTVSHISSFHMDYIDALRSEGHEVLIMARGEGADYNIPFEKKLFSKKNGECRKMIRSIIDSGSFDLIILNTSLAAFHIRAAVGKKRPRVVNIVHGYLFNLKPHGGIGKRIKRLMLLFAERIVKGRTDAIITMNSEDTAIAKKYALTSGEIIETRGFGIKTDNHPREKATLRAELFPEDKLIILFAGELSARKNQDFLIRLLPRIKEQVQDAELWLLGDGDKREELIALAESLGVSHSVKLPGRSERVRDYMAACDLYVSASLGEGLPFNIVEALLEGVSVVASDVKGHRDILGDGSPRLFSPLSYDEALPVILRAISEGQMIDGKKIARKYTFDEVFCDTLKKIKKAGKVGGA